MWSKTVQLPPTNSSMMEVVCQVQLGKFHLAYEMHPFASKCILYSACFAGKDVGTIAIPTACLLELAACFCTVIESHILH